MPTFFLLLASTSHDFAFFEHYLAVALSVCAMFGVGATLSVRDFLAVVKSPKGVVLTLAIQILITPLLAIAIARVLSVPAGIAAGLILIASLPGGSFSNLISYIGRGNVALSISATAICTLLCIITTTFVITVFGAAQLPDSITMPIDRILFEIGCCTLLPLVVGMVVQRFAPQWSFVLSKWFVRLSLLLLAIFVVGALSSGRVEVLAFGWKSVAALVLFGWLSLWVAVGMGLLFRLPKRDVYTVVVEVVVRNANLGILLKAVLFPARSGVADPIGESVLFAVLVYGVIALIIVSFESVVHVRQMGFLYGRKEDAQSSAPSSAKRNHKRTADCRA